MNNEFTLWLAIGLAVCLVVGGLLAYRTARRATQRREAQRAAAAEAARLQAQRRAAAQEANRAEAARRAEAETARANAEAARVVEARRAAEAARAEAARVAAAEAAARAAAERAAAEAASRARVAAAREAARLAAEEAAAAATVPAALDEPVLVAPAAVPPPPKPRKTRDQTLVMVADDSKIVRVKTGRLLEQHRYRVTYAVDGFDAAQQLHSQVPDIVITDVEMPGMDGFELTRHVRENPLTAHIPVIMITAAEDKHRADAQRAGVSMLLGKPYPEDALIGHIRMAMGDLDA